MTWQGQRTVREHRGQCVGEGSLCMIDPRRFAGSTYARRPVYPVQYFASVEYISFIFKGGDEWLVCVTLRLRVMPGTFFSSNGSSSGTSAVCIPGKRGNTLSLLGIQKRIALFPRAPSTRAIGARSTMYCTTGGRYVAMIGATRIRAIYLPH